MKILACPQGELEGNACQFMLYHEMQELGCEVYDYRLVNPLKGNYDIIHIHWPELFANGKSFIHVLRKSVFFLSAMYVQKLKKAKIVWTCHDVISHYGQYPFIEKQLMKCFIKMVDGLTIPLQSSHEYACHYFPELRGKPFAIIPTGHYKEIYKNVISQSLARENIGIPTDAKVIGFVGNISEYKGIRELLSAFNEMEDQNTVLLLAGIPNTPEIKRVVEKAAEQDDRIKVYWGLIPNDELQLYLNASDLIALPFRKINNSGSIYLALSFNRQVLVPDFPQMMEVREEYAPDYVNTYPKGKLTNETLEENLYNAITKKKKSSLSLNKMDYEILSKQTVDFYNKLTK